MDNEKLTGMKVEEIMDQAEDEILVETYTMIQRKVSEIKSEVGREISVKNVESRKAIVSERDHYTDSIFSEVKKKLSGYKKSESYVQYLKQSLASGNIVFSKHFSAFVLLQVLCSEYRARWLALGEGSLAGYMPHFAPP